MRHKLFTMLFGGTLLLTGCGDAPAPAAPNSASPTATVQAKPSPVRLSPSPTRKPPARIALLRTTGSRGVALTFDDGPHPTWTPKVLDVLHARGVKATFCVLGQYAKAYPDLIRRIVRDGHTLCNHSWGHEYRLGTWTPSQIRANLSRTNQAILAAAPDAQIAYFRHPGGNWTQRAMQVARELGMRPLHWSADPWDWDRPGTKAIINRVINNTRASGVVLLHDGGGDRSQTVAALPQIISALRGKYRLVPMPLPAQPKPSPSPTPGTA